MKALWVLSVAVSLAVLGCSTERPQAPLSSQNPDGNDAGLQAEFDALYDQISQLDQQGIDVPQESYDRYFELERQLHPEYYETSGRVQTRTLDELQDACPGAVLEGPEPGDDLYAVVCGQTNTAANDCSYPNCRLGRDVMIQINSYGYDFLRVTTAGSRFDTYLCLYSDECCDGSPYEYNNNNPGLNNGQRLAAGIQTCLYPETTYYLVLDGAGPSAFGSYCLTIEMSGDNCD